MDPKLLNACSTGDFTLGISLIDAKPEILLSTTPHSNNCLHIAAMLGHHEFAWMVWSRAPFLLSGINIDGETPLIAALMAANLSLASGIISAMQHDDLEEGRPLNRVLLQLDRRGENALHHAMRNGFQNLALRLLYIEPRLSQQVMKTGESAMYMAARRGYSRVVQRLLEIPFSADSGPENESALYAAVRFDHTGIVKQLLNGRPQLAYCTDTTGVTPLQRAVVHNSLELVKIFLECDPNLAYIKCETKGNTLFTLAAEIGSVSIAEEIMRACPDSVYTPNIIGYNALQEAIKRGKPDFVDYILRTPQLHRLINQADNNGNLPLHHAAQMCDPKLLRSLLTHAGQDYTAVNVFSSIAVNVAHGQTTLLKTLKWAKGVVHIVVKYNSLWMETHIKRERKKDDQGASNPSKYTSNTSLVTALLATITFAAAFTLPGGFGTDPADARQPIFARKTVFQVFLISDTIAMCSSLAVAFLCILATWEDLDFLLNYRKTTKALMWCAYEATAVAFGTGLFTVIAPNNFWLAILILVFSAILPLLSKIIGEWPLLILRYRLRGLFIKDLIPNI